LYVHNYYPLTNSFSTQDLKNIVLLPCHLCVDMWSTF